MDRVGVELSESPAAHANDTNTRSGGLSATLDSPAQPALTSSLLSATSRNAGPTSFVMQYPTVGCVCTRRTRAPTAVASRRSKSSQVNVSWLATSAMMF